MNPKEIGNRDAEGRPPSVNLGARFNPSDLLLLRQSGMNGLAAADPNSLSCSQPAAGTAANPNNLLSFPSMVPSPSFSRQSNPLGLQLQRDPIWSTANPSILSASSLGAHPALSMADALSLSQLYRLQQEQQQSAGLLNAYNNASLLRQQQQQQEWMQAAYRRSLLLADAADATPLAARRNSSVNPSLTQDAARRTAPVGRMEMMQERISSPPLHPPGQGTTPPSIMLLNKKNPSPSQTSTKRKRSPRASPLGAPPPLFKTVEKKQERELPNKKKSKTVATTATTKEQPKLCLPTTFPCRARNMPLGHNAETALLKVEPGVRHGDKLFCSHAGCRKDGSKFQYCAFCQTPVARRNFRGRHEHRDLVMAALAAAQEEEEEQKEAEEEASEESTAMPPPGDEPKNNVTALALSTRGTGETTKEQAMHEESVDETTPLPQQEGNKKDGAVKVAKEPLVEAEAACGPVEASSQTAFSSYRKPDATTTAQEAKQEDDKACTEPVLSSKEEEEEEPAGQTKKSDPPNEDDDPRQQDAATLSSNESVSSSEAEVMLRIGFPSSALGKTTNEQRRRWARLLAQRPSSDDSEAMRKWEKEIVETSRIGVGSSS